MSQNIKHLSGVLYCSPSLRTPLTGFDLDDVSTHFPVHEKRIKIMKKKIIKKINLSKYINYYFYLFSIINRKIPLKSYYLKSVKKQCSPQNFDNRLNAIKRRINNPAPAAK